MGYYHMYYHLFNALTDALEAIEAQNFGQAKDILILAQQETEEMFMDEDVQEENRRLDPQLREEMIQLLLDMKKRFDEKSADEAV